MRLRDQVAVSEVVDKSALCSIVRDYKGALLGYDIEDNERMIQPAIHSILQYAATVVQRNTGRVFTVQSEPVIMDSYKFLRSGEAVLESIKSASQTIRVLVEVKGTGTFPYGFTPGKDFQSLMCQLLQQVALALVAGKWNDEILAAAATADMWYLMQITDDSKYMNSPVKLSIRDILYHSVNIPKFGKDAEGNEDMDAVEDSESLLQLLHYLVSQVSK